VLLAKDGREIPIDDSASPIRTPAGQIIGVVLAFRDITERMHLTLKKEATKPAAKNFLQQQAKFDDFIECYNRERPHQAINMQYPAELYEPSPRPYRGLTELEYPFHDRTIMVTRCGRICFGRQKINLTTVFAGKNVGVKEVSERIWLVTFMDYDLGFFDDETCRLESAINPFEPRVLPMSPV
jgi:putative transposase